MRLRQLLELQDPCELVCRSGSDLLSKYVGETERAIAAAFREADAQDAVLLFDEADTFLRNREKAERTWEVSLVNAILLLLKTDSALWQWLRHETILDLEAALPNVS